MNHLFGFGQMKVSKTPSWVIEKDGDKYGYEQVGESRRFFIVRHNTFSREYISDIPDWIQLLIQDADKIHEEKALSHAHDPYVDSHTTDKVGYMPDALTSALFEKWQNMPVEERLIMLQTTDNRYIEERPGRGRRMYKYVAGHYMVMCANMAFGFAWSSNVLQWERTETEVICMGYVEAKIQGELIRKYAVGQQDISIVSGSNPKVPVCLGDNYKAAQMDMIKKALSFFGIAKDVYAGEV